VHRVFPSTLHPDTANPDGRLPAAPVLLLRVGDVCAQLSISRAAVYRLIAAGTLPSVTLGSTRRVVQSDLDRFVEDLATGRITVGGRGRTR